MSSRILASILASVALHGALAGGLLTLAGIEPVAEEKVYSVALVGVPSSAMQAGSSRPAPEPSVPEPSTPESLVPPPAPEEKKSETPAEARPKTIAAKTRPVKKPKPVKQTQAKPQAPQTVPDAGTGVSPASPEGGSGSSFIFTDGPAAYAEDAVDERPFVIRRVLPEYPERARRMNIRGRVDIRLIVDASGIPKDLRVHKAKPEGYFEEAAMAAARAMRFSPGKVRGRAVNTVVIIPFIFALR